MDYDTAFSSVSNLRGSLHPIDSAVAGKLFTHVKRTENNVTPSIANTDLNSLSEREQKVLQLLAKGLSNKEIAAQLFLSEGTVRNYVSSLFSKLDVSDRTQATLIAVRHGLVN